MYINRTNGNRTVSQSHRIPPVCTKTLSPYEKSSLINYSPKSSSFMHILRLCTTTVLSFLSIGLGGVELTINTDRQDRVIPIYPPKSLFAGYKNTDKYTLQAFSYCRISTLYRLCINYRDRNTQIFNLQTML